MLQLITAENQPPVVTNTLTVNYADLVEFTEELELHGLFVRLPVEQPWFAKSLSGKVMTGTRLRRLLERAVQIMAARDEDQLAADNERIMSHQNGTLFHIGRSLTLHKQAQVRDALAFNIIDSVARAQILRNDAGSSFSEFYRNLN